MHISGLTEATWNTLFSIFERWRPPPPTSRGPGKLSPSPLSTGLLANGVLSEIALEKTLFSRVTELSRPIVSTRNEAISMFACTMASAKLLLLNYTFRCITYN